MRLKHVLSEGFYFRPQPPVFTRYQEYVASLQTLISEVLDHIKGLEITLTALKLESLSLEDSALSEVRSS